MNLRDNLTIAASSYLELINAVAFRLYKSGTIKTFRAEVPVISVGNIALGGTGKTPLVAALARILLAAGKRPVILTRGYKRVDKTPLVIAKDRDVAWQRAGDEPTLLARALPDVPIVVDADRVRGAKVAVQELGATHLLLDDGFQHWRLARDIDIVVVDANDPFGANVARRESPGALGRANGVVISHAQDRSHALAAVAVLSGHAPNAIFVATHLVANAVHLGEERHPPGFLAGRSVIAMAGLASPENFVNSLGDIGARVDDLRFFPDHHRYRRSEVETILKDADATGALVATTAKDIVKIPKELVGRIAWLEVEATPIYGKLEDLLTSVLAPSALESAP